MAADLAGQPLHVFGSPDERLECRRPGKNAVSNQAADRDLSRAHATDGQVERVVDLGQIWIRREDHNDTIRDRVSRSPLARPARVAFASHEAGAPFRRHSARQPNTGVASGPSRYGGGYFARTAALGGDLALGPTAFTALTA